MEIKTDKKKDLSGSYNRYKKSGGQQYAAMQIGRAPLAL